ncbi:methionine adenosyltransferase [uncultured Eudoraea sp.]|uniref:methionine adenosyltransferase n=1 Tax=uncultured Eudoraea sp. TaxID=1035614 RepID=UPI00260C85E1|nr:methionine adenosyltransferase [uncultured Eudoraea sp.]
MAINIVIGDLVDKNIEMAERKGIGHPDTICDYVTEQISIELSKYYLKEFGAIMHHNVDKALLIGGQSKPAYKGGKIIKPISLIIAGRGTHQVRDKIIPVEEIAVETAKKWLRKNIRHLDVSRDVQITSKIRPGSTDLVELFNRFGKGEIPLANDTSFGAGFYPTTFLQDSIIKIEELLNAQSTKNIFPFIGEDIKVMGVKDHSKNYFTIAIAMIDKYIADLNDYVSKIKQLKEFVLTTLLLTDTTIYINTADNYLHESIYLTVTGTSAESGDDGQVGRGNRINGLITPYYPMSLEATAGKNPVSHIGKIYNYFAMDLSRAIVKNNFADEALVFIVSQIGKPINEPQLMHFKLKNIRVDKEQIEDLAKEKLIGLNKYWKRIINV